MAHSVEQHLSVTPSAYDVEIRRFIPGYDAMLDEVAQAIAEQLGDAPHVVDLGAGTGSLTERIAQHLPRARFTLLDVDPAMLAQAAGRLVSVRDRIAFLEASFDAPLPAADAFVASLALHHVHDPDAKRALFARIHAALRPGGVLVIADGMVPATGPFAAPVRRRWADHMIAHGDTDAQAYARFDEWAKEDTYVPVPDELIRLVDAGFARDRLDVRWRSGPIAVVVAVR